MGRGSIGEGEVLAGGGALYDRWDIEGWRVSIDSVCCGLGIQDCLYIFGSILRMQPH